MARQSEQMRKLMEERDRLAKEIEALQQQLIGIDRAISVLGGGDYAEKGRTSVARRTGVKEMILRLLEEHKANGLTASETIEAAIKRGQELDRASVSSLLSRLKREGVLTFDGNRYRIALRNAPAKEVENLLN